MYNSAMVQVSDIVRSVSAVAFDYPIEVVELFGSYARGTATESSDIDLLLRTDASFSLFDAVNFKGAVEKATGRSVDVISASAITGKTLQRSIDRDRMVIYERQS